MLAAMPSDWDGEPAQGRLTRRRLLARGAAFGSVAMVFGPLAACGGSGSPDEVESSGNGGGGESKGTNGQGSGPRVVVVGAGLAGLTCAYRLHQHGVDAALYEARPDRIGGRCWTARGFADGQVAEHGGEFIDSDHAHIRALVRELGLRLEDRVAYAKRRSGRYARLYYDSSLRDEDEVFRRYGELKRRLGADARRTGYFSDGYANPAAHRFDRLTVDRWLDREAPGGRNSLLGDGMRDYMANEFGADPRRLSATNLFYVLSAHGRTPGQSDGSDERFHVHGGNDRIASRLAGRLPAGALRLDTPLEALRRRTDGSYSMRFGGVRKDVIADRVVLATPFTTLRDVDLGRSGLSASKREAIDQLGMGTNSKLLMQFRHRPGHYRRWNGELNTDRPPFLDTWDTSLTQPGADGLITIYSGGAQGAGYRARQAHGPAPAAVVRDTLAALERVVPGIRSDFAGKAWLDDWSADPWVHGSYAAYLPGQTVAYAGVVARPEAGLHFAGEHTSIAYQGFLEGAVGSGERCTEEVLRGLSWPAANRS
jgi:monoamine oxidase